MANARAVVRKSNGFSLVEVMVAMTIGLFLLGGLTAIFINSSQANHELQKTAQQIENGRFAIATISQDLRLAGFYGHLHQMPAAPAALPDPCEIASTANLSNGLAYPVQGYQAADFNSIPVLTTTTCVTKGLLTTANLKPGSDVLVIRRADTNCIANSNNNLNPPYPTPPCGAPPNPLIVTTLSNEVYIQATGIQAKIRFGNGAVLGNNQPDGSPSDLFLKDGATPAPVRKYHVHVYFVAPCSAGNGANGVCIAGDDTIPTLKRLELTVPDGGGATTMKLVPLVEGIEYLKLEYGVDNVPLTTSLATGVIGDATVDAYTPTPADWTTVIAAKVYVLARNTERSFGFVDTKKYTLGTVVVPAFTPPNDAYKRHVYQAEVHLMNPAGRREIP